MTKKDWTVLEMLDWTTDFLSKKNIKEARLDAEVLLSFSLNIKRLDLYLNFDRILKTNEIVGFKELIKKRAERFPVAYILGEKEFMSQKFKVNENVLIPRPETELLVEEAAKIARDLLQKNEKLMIVDTFTGSGCVAISLAKMLENFTKNFFVFGIDLSAKAIEIAQENIYLNGVVTRVRLVCGDILKPLSISALEDSVDLITANPPYIKTRDLSSLDKELFYEPKNALNGGDDGLFYYEKLIKESKKYLKENGFLVLEIDESLTTELSKIFEKAEFTDLKIKKDYQNLDRILVAKNKK